MEKPNMNAKDLIRGQKVTEAGEGQPSRRPRPNRPPGPGAGGPGGPGAEFDPREFMMRGGPGGPEGEEGGPGGPHTRMSMRPRGPFAPQEMSMIKDLLLLVATEVMGNDFDGKIARTLMKGEVPNAGALQHIMDEVRRIPDLPEGHQKLLQKIADHVNRGAAEEQGGAPPV